MNELIFSALALTGLYIAFKVSLHLKKQKARKEYEALLLHDKSFPYKQGYEALRNYIHTNPYEEDTPDAEDWYNGFRRYLEDKSQNPGWHE